MNANQGSVGFMSPGITGIKKEDVKNSASKGGKGGESVKKKLPSRNPQNKRNYDKKGGKGGF